MNCQNGGNCKICFNKSFASNEKSKYWSEENKIKPINVFLQSNKKFIFNCDNCSHNFEGLLGNISVSLVHFDKVHISYVII